MNNFENENMSNTDSDIPQSNEIKDMYLTLKESKLLIGLVVSIAFLLALAYSMLADEVWSTEAKVIPPRLNEYFLLSSEVRKFQPLFENNDALNTQNSSNLLLEQIQPEEIFNQFVQNFNSTSNKRQFLINSEYFNDYI
ncbi:Wzz/FepE/Etk N-terminal domain-containing protein, partial [Photobacterium minamisatsumaniensis]|uniref:Wzz/FepE/Etk N-terminal domain-containing protein n=1 Tax=Photobacterium minamisatsumaniensis TaxID=2910233 RepID=UPI003D151A6D